MGRDAGLGLPPLPLGPRRRTESWDAGPVTGTLTITHNWGSTGTDAIFEANGVKVHLVGGSTAGVHWDDLSCAVS